MKVSVTAVPTVKCRCPPSTPCCGRRGSGSRIDSPLVPRQVNTSPECGDDKRDEHADRDRKAWEDPRELVQIHHGASLHPLNPSTASGTRWSTTRPGERGRRERIRTLAHREALSCLTSS